MLKNLPIRWRTAGFLAALVLAELGLYHGGNYGKWVVQDRDGRLGWRLLPDQSGWSREYDVPEVINRFGYRGPEWLDPGEALERSESVFRVAVVGNSLTYGSGVTASETWPSVLEELLGGEFQRRRDPRRVVVMNFAVQGYVFEQMARVFDDEIVRWKPDLLIVPSLAPDIRPMAAPVAPVEYFGRRQIVRTAIYDLLRDRVIDKWIPPPGGQPLEGPELKQAQLDEALPAMRERFEELVATRAADAEAGDVPSFERLEEELRKVVMPAPPEAIPRVIWEVLDTPQVASLSGQLKIDLRLEMFGALEQHLRPEIWGRIDGPVQEVPWTADHRFWWWKMAARLERIQRTLDEYGGKLSIVTVTRLHEVLDENLPPDQQTVKPVDLFYDNWLPSQAVPRSDGRLFYTSTRRDFSRLQPEVTQALIQHGYLEGPNGTKRIDASRPGAESSLFLFHDVGHFSPRGHAAFAELLARSLVDQGL